MAGRVRPVHLCGSPAWGEKTPDSAAPLRAAAPLSSLPHHGRNPPPVRPAASTRTASSGSGYISRCSRGLLPSSLLTKITRYRYSNEQGFKDALAVRQAAGGSRFQVACVCVCVCDSNGVYTILPMSHTHSHLRILSDGQTSPASNARPPPVVPLYLLHLIYLVEVIHCLHACTCTEPHRKGQASASLCILSPLLQDASTRRWSPPCTRTMRA